MKMVAFEVNNNQIVHKNVTIAIRMNQLKGEENKLKKEMISTLNGY